MAASTNSASKWRIAIARKLASIYARIHDMAAGVLRRQPHDTAPIEISEIKA